MFGGTLARYQPLLLFLIFIVAPLVLFVDVVRLRLNDTVPPEGNSISFHYAGFWRRLQADLIDALAMLAIAFPCSLLFDRLMRGTGADPFVGITGRLSVSGFVLVALLGLYNMTYLVGQTGQSWGRKSRGLRVVDYEGYSIGFGKALLRNILSGLSSVALWLGFLWIVWDRRKQAWHDKLTRTFVIVDPEGEYGEKRPQRRKRQTDRLNLIASPSVSAALVRFALACGPLGFIAVGGLTTPVGPFAFFAVGAVSGAVSGLGYGAALACGVVYVIGAGGWAFLLIGTQAGGGGGHMSALRALRDFFQVWPTLTWPFTIAGVFGSLAVIPTRGFRLYGFAVVGFAFGAVLASAWLALSLMPDAMAAGMFGALVLPGAVACAAMAWAQRLYPADKTRGFFSASREHEPPIRGDVDSQPAIQTDTVESYSESYCYHCGGELRAGATTCSACGKRL